MSARIHARELVRIAAFGIGTALLLAACSSSGGGGGSSAQAGAAPTGKVALDTQTGPLGSYLTDSAGKSIYMFASDTATSSTCSGTCLQFWPPVLTKADSVAATGDVSGMISTLGLSNGTKQVVYAGHPLYYYAQDSKPGEVNGQGRDDFGAKWWLLTPAGEPITQSAPTSAGNSGAPPGGGYGGYP